MSRLFLRTWALETSDAVRYEGMRMAFRAAQAGAGGSSSCDVTVWMPARELVESLHLADTVIRVLAGYRDTGPVEVMQGAVVTDSVRDKRAAAEPSVTWQISPSKTPIQRASVSKSWSKVRASEVIEHLRQAMGVPADVVDLPEDVLFARGHVVERSPKTAMSEVVAACGAQWALQDGRLRVWPLGGVARATADLWAPSTGLLEAVAPAGDDKVTARALLRPGLRPGDTVRVQSPSWSGDIRVQEVVHEGDSHGAAWFTSVTGVTDA